MFVPAQSLQFVQTVSTVAVAYQTEFNLQFVDRHVADETDQRPASIFIFQPSPISGKFLGPWGVPGEETSMSVDEVFDVRQKLKVLRSLIPDCKRYLVPSKIVGDLFTILGVEKREEILETERRSRKDAVKLLMEAVIAKKEEGLNLFIHALKIQNDNNSSYERFLNPLDEAESTPMNPGNEEANKYFAFIIQCLEGQISRSVSPGELEAILLKLLSEDIIDEEDMLEISGMGLQEGLVKLFTIMPRGTPEWPLKFFNALEEAKPQFSRKLDPCGESPVMNKEEMAATASLSQAGGIRTGDSQWEETIPKRRRTSDPLDLSGSAEEAGLAGCGGSAEDLMEVDEDELLASDSEGHGEFSDDDNEEKDEGSEKKVQPHMSMRKYQYELAADAIEGRNTIICAPTGSGKTRVALYIVQRHLERGLDDDSQKRKVVFLARTVPLVSQQFKIFEKYLPDYMSRLVTGETEDHDDLHLMLNDYDILVLTPKILENHLIPDKIPSLSVFSLIIFDECHHTRKGEPYNSVMLKYLESKKLGEKNLPQIVGLTASIGVDKASTVDKAVNSIINIMGNLDVKIITQVKDPENLKELEETVPRPDEDLKELQPREGDKVSLAIESNMKVIENLLERQFPPLQVDPEIDCVRIHLRKRPADRKSQKYGQWAVKISRETSKLHIPEQPDRELSLQMIERRRLFAQNVQLLAETLGIYNDALDVHELTRPLDVLEHLKSKLDPRHPSSAPERTPLENQLCTLFEGLQRELKRTAPTNPNLRKLSEAITTKLEGQWDRSRVMVFVRTRATCVALCSWLTSSDVAPELQQLNASPFTGSGAKQEVGGMTQYEQEGVVEKFRAGEVKLLVCTSVGQEGMDIPDCNLVIRYNHVGNEVTTVQVRGRCRKAGGLSMLLAMPPVIRKERINKQRVEIMNKAIARVTAMRKQEVSNQVKKSQNEAMDKEKRKRAGQKTKTSKRKQATFFLACTLCRKVRVPGSQIRTIDKCHHVIIGNDLVENKEVSIRSLTKPRKVDHFEFTGEIICNKCPVSRQKFLGTTLQYQGNLYLTVKAESWVVLDDNNMVVKSGKWKWKDVDALYDISELTSRDVDLHLGQTPEDEEDQMGGDEEEEQGAVGGMAN